MNSYEKQLYDTIRTVLEEDYINFPITAAEELRQAIKLYDKRNIDIDKLRNLINEIGSKHLDVVKKPPLQKLAERLNNERRT